MFASCLPVAYAGWSCENNCENMFTENCDICESTAKCGVCKHCRLCADKGNCHCKYCDPNHYSHGTQVIYEATGSESYTITVPAVLAPGGEGTVTLSGTWADNRIVTVTADKTVTLTNSILASDTKILDIDFTDEDGVYGISEKGNNTEAQTFTQQISVAEVDNALFGTWSGKFNYNVEVTLNIPIKFGEKYVSNFGAEWYIVFNEDGTATGSIVEDDGFPADSWSYTDTEIKHPLMPENVKYWISEDGTEIVATEDGEIFEVLTYVPDGTIAFTIDHSGYIQATYFAVEGMTWKEWADSEYNTSTTEDCYNHVKIGYFINQYDSVEYAGCDTDEITLDDVKVKSTDQIQANVHYEILHK